MKQELDQCIPTFGKKAGNAQALLNLLYQKPSVSITEVSSALECSFPTANALIGDFVQQGILEETTGSQRNKLFEFQRYIQIYRV